MRKKIILITTLLSFGLGFAQNTELTNVVPKVSRIVAVNADAENDANESLLQSSENLTLTNAAQLVTYTYLCLVVVTALSQQLELNEVW